MKIEISQGPSKSDPFGRNTAITAREVIDGVSHIASVVITDDIFREGGNIMDILKEVGKKLETTFRSNPKTESVADRINHALMSYFDQKFMNGVVPPGDTIVWNALKRLILSQNRKNLCYRKTYWLISK